jgi:hypothetical protein
LPLLFNFALEYTKYTIRKVKEIQLGLKFNGASQLLVSAGNVNLLGDNINTTKKNKEALIDTSKEFGLEVNTQKTTYMSLSLHQNAGQNHAIRIANRSFENVANFKYFETTLINQNFIHKEIKSKLNLDDSLPLSENVTIKIYKAIIMPVILYGCEDI